MKTKIPCMSTLERTGATLALAPPAQRTLTRESSATTERTVPLRTVEPGMIIQQEVRTSMGTLLVPSGFEVTPVFLERLRHLGPDILNETVAVLEAVDPEPPEAPVESAS